ncbi:MAG: hypothetical protein CMP22_07820 [Rickettsiales bacterium]|nr:hypothetical protein [Rickettsiales bacterium]|tara:strand:- start:631 stop:966 length:336 start_codon:yes stop_codon:yes gene_type:complete
MSVNKIQDGNVLDLTAPSGGVVSGTPVLIGTILCVPVTSADEGDVFAADVVGVYEIAKATGALTEGAKVYWDNSAKKVTATASGNTLVGVAVEGVASGAETVKVRLDGVAR